MEVLRLTPLQSILNKVPGLHSRKQLLNLAESYVLKLAR